MELTEKEIEDQCIQFFESAGCLVYKPNKFNSAIKAHLRNIDKGAPDLWLFYQGTTIGCEIKKPKGTQSADQIAFEARLKRQSIPYYLCRGLDDAQNILREIKELASGRRLSEARSLSGF